MKIEIIQESEHYVLIRPPMLDDGSAPTRDTILPLLEQLRVNGLRYLDLHWRLSPEAVMVCEKIEPPETFFSPLQP